MDRLRALEIALYHLFDKYFGPGAKAEVQAIVDAEMKKAEEAIKAVEEKKA